MKTVFKDLGAMVATVILCLVLISCSFNGGVSTKVETLVFDEIHLREMMKIRLPGDHFTVKRYCRDITGLMDVFVAVVSAEGDRGYNLIMETDGIPCFDSRILEDIFPIYIALVEKVKTFYTPGNFSYNNKQKARQWDLWKFVDVTGQKGFTWFEVNGQGV